MDRTARTHFATFLDPISSERGEATLKGISPDHPDGLRLACRPHGRSDQEVQQQARCRAVVELTCLSNRFNLLEMRRQTPSTKGEVVGEVVR